MANSARGRPRMCSANQQMLWLFLQIAVTTYAWAAEEPSDDGMPESATRYEKAISPEQLWRVCADEFYTAPASELSQLELHDNPGVAFAAAWEPVRRVLENPGKDEDRSGSYGSMCRFVGFVEGRLKVHVPELWLKTLFHARITRQMREDIGPTVNFELPRNQVESGRHTTSSDVLTPDSAPVVDRRDGAFLRAGNRETRLPAEFMDAYRRSIARIPEPVFGQDSCILALYENRAYPYTLYCLGRHDGTIQWKNRVWAAGGLMHYEGIGHHRMWLAKTESMVIVFGVSDDAAYIEGFQLSDGVNCFRFSTWYHFRVKW